MRIVGVTAATKIGPNAPTISGVTDVGTAREFGNGAVDVAFTLPSVNTAVSYVVTSSEGQTATGTSSPIRVQGLAAISQTFTVYGINNITISGDASAASAAIIPTSVPEAPLIGNASAGNGNGAVNFTGQADGGKPLIQYKAFANDAFETASPTAPITISGLSNGTAYTFKVFAQNANGLSFASGTSNSVTPAAPVAPPSGGSGGGGSTPTQQVTITGATLTALSSDTWRVNVSGSNISAQPPTNIGVGAGSATGISSSNTSASGQITGLTAGVTYNIQFFNGALPLTASYNATAPTYSGQVVEPPSGGSPPPVSNPCAGYPYSDTSTQFAGVNTTSRCVNNVLIYTDCYLADVYTITYYCDGSITGSSRRTQSCVSYDGGSCGTPPTLPVVNPPTSPGTGGGGTGGGGCFVVGTKITLFDGSLKNIEDLQVGDGLKTFNIPSMPDSDNPEDWSPKEAWSVANTNSFTHVTNKVTHVRVSPYNQYYHINNKYKVTWEHYILVKRDDVWQFLQVKSLKLNDFLLGEQKEEIEIVSIDCINSWVNTVELDVEDNDFYFADGILAHNIRPDKSYIL